MNNSRLAKLKKELQASKAGQGPLTVFHVRNGLYYRGFGGGPETEEPLTPEEVELVEGGKYNGQVLIVKLADYQGGS